MKTSTTRRGGLSIIEVFLIIVTIVLVVAILLPMWKARSRAHMRAKRISCVSNLKFVGLATLLWANDHNDQFPWGSTNRESTLAYVNSPQVFQHFAILSNELGAARVLACPTDENRVRARNFVALANTNISYFVGIDSRSRIDSLASGLDSLSSAQMLLSGDRNVTGGTLSNGFMRILTQTNVAGWSPALHNRAGNVGLGDGSVQQLNPAGLNTQIQAQPFPIVRLAIP